LTFEVINPPSSNRILFALHDSPLPSSFWRPSRPSASFLFLIFHSQQREVAHFPPSLVAIFRQTQESRTPSMHYSFPSPLRRSPNGLRQVCLPSSVGFFRTAPPFSYHPPLSVFPLGKSLIKRTFLIFPSAPPMVPLFVAGFPHLPLVFAFMGDKPASASSPVLEFDSDSRLPFACRPKHPGGDHFGPSVFPPSGHSLSSRITPAMYNVPVQDNRLIFC